ncbi:YtxH domain-containing protein [Neobacillus mesonae]|uniref:YtxH domain-containing protein n=1 Tax=Neobacillus mesonae TaxID=1193713 RepID=A0A3T0HV72_9BACI|nr:YtxH domain-containing protein [Neobacillus mesonae]AZU60887.1 YtxH domain-containing protein [Neobacillus mesonae]MED4202454.1 YtxH domain-containing protein [Neobacillus mesonae]
MTKKNLFWKGLFLGALAGGAVSLFDKYTREVMKDHVQKTSSKVYETVRHPGETVAKIKSTIEQVSEDFSYLAEKVEEIRELTPQVTDMIKETKDTFSKSEDDELLEELLEEKVTNY